jgi:hypothetical protein
MRLVTLLSLSIFFATVSFSCTKKEKPVEPQMSESLVLGYDTESDVYNLLEKRKIKLAGLKPLPQKALGHCPDLKDKRAEMIENHLLRKDILQSNRVPCEIIVYGKKGGVEIAEIRFPAWQSAKFRGKIDKNTLKAVGQDRFLNFNKTLLFHGLAILDEETMPASDAADYRDASERARKSKMGVWDEFCGQE